jgi:uncharacterized SAM-binding protein YcdF (DUF218 family)
VNRTVRCVLLALAVAGAVVVASLAILALVAGHWLEAPAQSPKRADAIAVLGGDEEGERASRALALYRQGHAPTIVLTGLQMGANAVPAGLNWRAEFLEARGVPKTAIRLELEARNSYMEAEQLLALMRKEGWRTLIVVSDPPHMRRLAWTWARVFEGSGLDYVLVASELDWWLPGDWWRDEKSGAFVIMEYIKLAYYVAKR